MHQCSPRIASQDFRATSARVSAAGILLDRGWGRAPQPHTGEDDKEIHITIRDVIAEQRQEMAGGPFTVLRWEPPSCWRSRRSRKNRRAKSRKNSVTYGALGRCL